MLSEYSLKHVQHRHKEASLDFRKEFVISKWLALPTKSPFHEKDSKDKEG